MKLVNYIARIIKYTLQHVTRNGWQSLLVILVVAVTLVIAQLFAVVTIASNNLLTYFENQPQVTVFFRDEATEEQILQIQETLYQDERTEETVYTSKDEAVALYKEQNQDNPELLEFVTADILPASLEVSATDPTFLVEIANEFEQNQLVETVVFHEDLVESLTRLTNAVRLAGLVLLSVLLFNSASIILLVVANNISAFRREIEVMRLVGAGAWSVRWPFLLDGIIFAVSASTLASIAMYLFLPYMNEFAQLFLPAVALFPPANILVYNLWVFTTLVGVGLTTVISYVATWRYLQQ